MKITKEMYQKYLEECAKGKNLSKHTIKAYKTDLKQFIDYIGNESEINKQKITQFMFYLNEQYKSKSAKRKLASLHAFFEYLEYEEKLVDNPMNKMKYKIKQERVLPRIIEHENLYALYKVLYKEENRNNKNFIRDCAIIELLLATGIRVSELCTLKISDVNIENKYIRVFGKGSKERIIYLGNEKVTQSLEVYKQTYRVSANKKDYFFVNRNDHLMNDQSVRNLIKYYVKNAGIEENITPHMFRHTFATMLLEEDVDIRYIQNILGHSSITTTQIYTYISTSKQKEILIHKNPRNRLQI
ncbi:MAG: recombinase XerC [Erysipelotrichia bacterium]|nr:recombinase XerC [Erysipelotrichia bacterium]NCC55391.1 recombinase XerC [Erysipelotrichia bacterium]